ncbi:MAG: sigma-54 dependent transcriptional regulator [Candidatus Latescibacterota bacterium]
MPADVLVVEDDGPLRHLLSTFVREMGHAVRGVATGQEAVDQYARNRPDLVLLDIKLPDVDGLQVLRRLKELDRRCPVVVMSSYSGADTIVEAIKLGAENYLTKPTPLPELRVLIDTLLEERLSGGQGDTWEVQGVIARSPAMHEVLRMVRRVADTRATVLIRGESGTGKEVIARAIHLLGASAAGSFVPVDCTSIPANLMESELFGHEAGAFTDARRRKRGLLELADHGTLFLDEIGLLPLDLQAKLLNVLETQSFRRVGGTEQVQVAVRFLAATNEDLEEAVHLGRFREDLYYRLNVVPIDLPPLREREDDVLLLAEHYLEVFTSLHATPPRRLADDARALLRSYSWPGNVRELRNVVERVVLMTDKRTIHADDLIIDRRARHARGEPSSGQPVLAGGLRLEADGRLSVVFPPQGMPLAGVERALIEAALQHTTGNVTRAAALLRVSRDTLRYRMAKYGLEGT